MIYQEPLAPFVCAEKHERAWERAAQRWYPASVQAPRNALLSPDCVVGSPQGRVFRREMRITLLSRLDRVQRMHQHVARRASNTSSNHCVNIWRPALSLDILALHCVSRMAVGRGYRVMAGMARLQGSVTACRRSGIAGCRAVGLCGRRVEAGEGELRGAGESFGHLRREERPIETFGFIYARRERERKDKVRKRRKKKRVLGEKQQPAHGSAMVATQKKKTSPLV